MSHSHSVVFLHLVFSTKLRIPYLLDCALRNELHVYLGSASRHLGCAPVIVGGVEDHVHMLARLGRDIAISGWVKEVKRTSSIWIKKQTPALESFAWQTGYGVFAVGKSNLEAVRTYIANQEEHHRKKTYQDEMRALLRAHDETWDERQIWE
jgi:putative transposase